MEMNRLGDVELNNATSGGAISNLGEQTDREQSEQDAKNKVGLELIESSDFLRPLLYVQDINRYNEDPKSKGYIRGRYEGTGINRRFVEGDGAEFTEYLENSTVTDIGFDGNYIYVVDNEIGHYRVNDPEKDPRILDGLPPIKVTATQIETLAKNVANKMGQIYNRSKPIFDAELGYLRTNFVHSSVAPYGNTMALRISRPSLAIKNLAEMGTPEVDDLMATLMRSRMNILISGSTGAGKAARDSELVPTPKGWKRHGDLKVGDYVFSRKGKPTKVLGVYPQGKMEVYRVTLSDGRTVDVSGDHLWTINDVLKNRARRNKKGLEHVYDTVTTDYMYEKGVKTDRTYGHNTYKFRLPKSEAVEYSEKEFKVEPYAMGALLGDGSFLENAIVLSSEDDWIPRKVAKLIGAEDIVDNKKTYSWYFRIAEDSPMRDGYTKGVKNIQTAMLFEEDMMVKCGERTIPEEYLYGSIEQRYELLQGLMDTDGTIKRDGKRYTTAFTTTSEQLKDDVITLARSLGLEVTFTKHKKRKNGNSIEYTVRFLVPHKEKENLFTLPRKVELAKEAQQYKKKKADLDIPIVSIEKLDEKDDMTCIMVDNEEHLYLVGDYVVTHNTEYQKALVGYIPNNQKITLMEDTLDSHIKEIYPDKDINSWRTVRNEKEGSQADDIDFQTLLRAALRNFPDWAMVSEVRGAEAGALLSVALSGHAVMTTLHAQGAESIPERLADMVSMGNSKMDYGALQRNILSVFKIGVHLERGTDPDTGKTIRYIREIYEYVDYDKDNGVIGYPIYKRFQQYDKDTDSYTVQKKHYRMSDLLIRTLEDNRELDNVPRVFTFGEYEHKTMADRKNITKGDD